MGKGNLNVKIAHLNDARMNQNLNSLSLLRLSMQYTMTLKTAMQRF